MSQDLMPTVISPQSSSCSSRSYRRQRPKIEKSNEEFKQHERILMGKRNDEVNNAVTKKCHMIWNQYLCHERKKPHELKFDFVYHNIDKYLAVCDNYEPSQHKDPKQKWWNNQKASEMSQGFLPSVLNATDEMAQFLGSQISASFNPEFTNYCIFELLETAITSVFSTMRSGSNEVFLRTSFQYSKANLRKKLISYFTDQELRAYDLKARKKKDLWTKLIKQKKERLLALFTQKRSMHHGHPPPHNRHSVKLQPADDSHLYHNVNNNNDTLPPSIINHYSNISNSSSDNMSCSTSNNSLSFTSANTNQSSASSSSSASAAVSGIQNSVQPIIPPINWSELNHSSGYQPYQTLNITPYSHPAQQRNIVQHRSTFVIPQPMAYGSHRECTDCLSYMKQLNRILDVNKTLQRENTELRQLNHQFVAERQEWRNKQQQQTLLQQQQQQPLQSQSNENWMVIQNNNNNHNVNVQNDNSVALANNSECNQLNTNNSAYVAHQSPIQTPAHWMN